MERLIFGRGEEIMEKKLSVVVSVYNEEEALPLFYETAKPVLQGLPWDYELLFVNDGSEDRSSEILDRLAAEDDRIKVVSFSRNFGHEATASGTGLSVWMRICSTRPPACRRL